jgi:hypothetical protein
MALKPTEEKRVLQAASRRWPGGQAASYKAASWQKLGRMKQTDKHVPACPVEASYISSTEEELQGLVMEDLSAGRRAKIAKTAAGSGSRGSQGVLPAYPLRLRHARSVARTNAEGPRPLEKEMHEGLEASWKVHKSTPEAVLALPDIEQVINVMQVQSDFLSDALLHSWDSCNPKF